MAKAGRLVKAIILAGGCSQRIKLKVPKQLVRIGKRPLLTYTLDVFEKCKSVDSIILVAHKKIIQQCRALIKKNGYRKIEQVCLGGKTRQQSVFNALCRIKNCNYVVIHDGVRPFVTADVILRTIRAAKRFNAASCAVKAIDTIAEEREGFIGRILRREKLWHLQTPQAFKFDLIFKSHLLAKTRGILNASDDSQLLLGQNKPVKLIEGSYKNRKITTQLDLFLMKGMRLASLKKTSAIKREA